MRILACISIAQSIFLLTDGLSCAVTGNLIDLDLGLAMHVNAGRDAFVCLHAPTLGRTPENMGETDLASVLLR